MLQLENVSLNYGSFRALDNININAKEGELVVLLGANGAGKSSIFLTNKMDMIMNLADKIMVLNYGEKIAEGTPAQIRSNPIVIEAYLGSENAAA